MVDIYPVTGAFREAATVWEIASAYDIRVGVVNWWPTWPAPDVNGFIVTDHLDEHVKLKYAQTSAVETSGDSGIRDTVSAPIAPQALTWPDSLLREIESWVEAYGWLSIQDEQWLGLSAELYSRYEPELLFLYLKGPDAVQHGRWDAYEPHLFRSVDPNYVKQHQNAIPDVYRSLDRLLGDLLDLIGDEATLLIVSDHGASPVFGLFTYQSFVGGHEHSPPGLFIATGPGIRRGIELQGASIIDVAPTILKLLGLPTAESMHGGVLRDVLTPEFANSALEKIESWDFLVERTVPRSDSKKLSEEQLEALKALGYVD